MSQNELIMKPEASTSVPTSHDASQSPSKIASNTIASAPSTPLISNDGGLNYWLSQSVSQEDDFMFHDDD